MKRVPFVVLSLSVLLVGAIAYATVPGVLATYIKWTTSAASPCAAGTSCMWAKTSDGLPYWHKTDNTNTSLIPTASGTVTTISGPAEMTIANPTTTPAITWTSQAANKFLASPSGGSGAMTARVLTNVDLTSNTNAVLDTDWFFSPVIEMANGLHAGVYASFANHTCGTRFMTSQAITVTGIQMYCPGTSAKTVKLSLWNKAGTRLANVSVSCGSGASTTTGTFGSSQALSAGLLYYVSGWITDGSLGLGYGVANSDTGIADSQTGVKFPGSASIFWTGWGADSTGDTFPNGDNSNVMCQFVPVYTVP